MKDSGFIMDALTDGFKKSLFTITKSKEDAVVAMFLDWLNKKAHLKPVPDLQQKLMEMGPKLSKMAKNLDVSIMEGKVVIKTDAESESLLNLFRRGSSWFSPHPDVNGAILLALASGS